VRRRSTALVAGAVALTGLVVGVTLDRVDDGDEASSAPAGDPCASTAPLVAVAGNDSAGEGGAEITVVRPDGTRAVATGGWVATDPDIAPDHERMVVSRALGDWESAGPEATALWTLGLDGSDRRRVTDDVPEVYDSAPAWSPDGATIAFVRSTHPGSGILTVPVAGGEAQEVVPPEAEVEVDGPEWSPDGSRLAFVRRRLNVTGQPGDAELWTVAADGSGASSVGRVDLRATKVDWHPDGSRVLVSAYGDGEGTLVLVDLASGSTTPIARDSTFGRWSRTGTHVVHYTRVGATEEREWRLVESPVTGTALGDARDLGVTDFLYRYFSVAVAGCPP